MLAARPLGTPAVEEGASDLLAVWGVALAGEQGVRDVIADFLADFDLTVALSGHASLATVDGGAVVRDG